MERVIKFRAWDNQSKTMFYSSDAKNFDENTGREYFPFVFEIGYKGRRDLELMQFTGLHDRDGKEIYEGDIVTYYNQYADKTYTREARWDDKFACFGLFDKGNEWCQESDWVKIKNTQVIGNIYENKYLL